MSVQEKKVVALVEGMRSSGVSEAVVTEFEDAMKSVKSSVYTLMTRVKEFGDVSAMLKPRSKDLQGLLRANRFLATPTLKLLGVDVKCKAKSASLTPIAGLHVAHMDLTSDYLSRLLPWLVKQWDARSNCKSFSLQETEAKTEDKGIRRSTRTPKTTERMIELQNEWRTQNMVKVRLTFISTNLSSSSLHNWAHNYPFALRMRKRICQSG